MISKIKITFTNIICIILCIIISFEIYIIYQSSIENNKYIDNLPFKMLVVESDSMYPKLKTGDIIVVTHTKLARVNKDDMISFYKNGDIITHQVVETIDNKILVTKGTYNKLIDEPVTEENYIGKVKIIIPRLGNILNNNLIYRLLIIAALFIACLGYPITLQIIKVLIKGKNGKGD